MKTLILLSVIAQWNYGGFTADPGTLAPAKLNRATMVEALPKAEKPPRSDTPKPPEPEPERKPVAEPGPPPKVKMWEAEDCQGKTWKYHDREALVKFLRERNLGLKKQTTKVYQAEDCQGKTWEFEDKDRLIEFIRSRNQAIRSRQQGWTPPQPGYQPPQAFQPQIPMNFGLALGSSAGCPTGLS